MTPAIPEKQWVLIDSCFYFLGGLSLHNTGFFQQAEMHVFRSLNRDRAIAFCSKASAQLVVKCLLAHGVKGWKVVEFQR